MSANKEGFDPTSAPDNDIPDLSTPEWDEAIKAGKFHSGYLDEAPDLTAPKWAKLIDATSVKRGRPPVEVSKVSTTIRLDPDVITALRADGKGWQTRANALLRKGLGL